MKKIYDRKQIFGFALIEALIALAILGIGILSLAKFNSFLIESSGNAKSRSEAAGYASEKLAQLRNMLTESDFNASGDGVSGTGNVTGLDSVSGTSATFSRSWTIVNMGTSEAPYKNITVTVSWQDRFSKTQQVVTQTGMAWLDPAKGFSFAKTGETGLSGLFASAPTGKAVLGYGTTSTAGSTSADATGDSVQSGLLQKTENGNLLLLDSNGNILLSMGLYNSAGSSTTNTTSGSYVGFSVVEGYIYAKSTEADYFESVRPIVSDAAYCWMDKNDDGTVNVDTTYTSPTYGTTKKPYTLQRVAYKCYLGVEWYGNIALVWTSSKSGPTVCLGDPSITSPAYSSDSSSTLVAASGSRHYRGYKLLSGTAVVPGTTSATANVYQSTGIGVMYNDLGTKTYTQKTFSKQDFMLSNFSGGGNSTTTAACQSELAGFSVNSTGAAVTNPFVRDSSTSVYAHSTTRYPTDAGLYICLSEDWDTPSYCPNPWPDSSSSTLDAVIVNFAIKQAASDSTALVSSIAGLTGPGSGFSCSSFTASTNSSTGVHTFTTACTASLDGYISSVWDASFELQFAGSGVLCAGSATGNGTLNTSAGTISFADQSVSVVTQTQTIYVAPDATSCP